MNLPKLKIGDILSKYPIVQGGMGVGVSLSSLAGNVSLNGGIGVISGVEIGFNEPDYLKNKKEANLRALKKHIRKAKEICNNGVVGVNLMTVLNNFEEMVKACVKEKVDIIFSGAGLPLNLPKFTKETNTKIAPIVSSGRTAALICKSWDKRHKIIPDAIVVEGPKAGGHLGFSKEDLNDPSIKLENIVVEVIEAIKPYEDKYDKKIPVIAGGGISNGEDIANLLELGASGVQIGSLFVATDECDASDEFKQSYINCKSEDIKLIQSPVGMMGRAINNKFLDDVNLELRRPLKCIANCLKPCKPNEVKYCIADALINSQKGNLSDGFAFAGSNAYKVNEIMPVKQLMDKLVEETKVHLK